MSANLFLGIAWAVTFAIVMGSPLREQRAAAESGRVDSGGPFCSLPDAQQQAAARAFSAMTPTLRHPRCANCHGGVDPFKKGGGHVGGEMPVFSKKDEATGFEDEDQERTLAQCQECHGNVKGWRQPAPEVGFVNKSDTRLCVQMKRNLTSANEFLHHMEHDVGNVQFIAEAFRGTRALNEMGRDIFVAEAGRPFKPEPPSVTHARFLTLARAWVDAMGGEYPDEWLCGCAPLRYELRLGSEMTFMKEGVTFKERVQATVPLTSKSGSDASSNVMSGAGPLKAELATMELPKCRARVTTTDGTTQVLELKADPEDWISTLSVTLVPGHTTMQMHITCPEGSASSPPGVGLWSPTWLHMHRDEWRTDSVPVIRNWEIADNACTQGEFDESSGCSTPIARKTYERSSTCAGGPCTENTKMELWLITGGT